jgi:hypothetical protein
MQIKKVLALAAILGLFLACERNALKIDVRNVSYNLQWHRLDQVLFQMDTANFERDLQMAKQTYPYFFGDGTVRFWKTQRTDPAQIKLAKDVSTVMGNAENEVAELEKMLKHYFYYFPKSPEIQVIGYLSNLDFEYPIIFADSLLFIALDLYLGENHPAYATQPRYLAQKRQKDFLTRDAAFQIASNFFPPLPPDAPFVQELVYQGALLYFVNALMPEIQESQLFTYTAAELEFCNNNERMIWNYFIDNQLLFDSSLDPKRRFVYPAPFSKFRTSFDNETPGSIGKWVGYQIVRSYMSENNNTLNDLVSNPDYASIFKNSKYKP